MDKHWSVTSNYAKGDWEAGGVAILRYGEASLVHRDPERLRGENLRELDFHIVPALAAYNLGKIDVRVWDGKAMAFLLQTQADSLCAQLENKPVQALPEAQFTQAEVDAIVERRLAEVAESLQLLFQEIDETYSSMNRPDGMSNIKQARSAVFRMKELKRHANLGN